MLRGPLLPTILEDDPWDGLDIDEDVYGDLAEQAERHAALDEDEDGGPVDDHTTDSEVILAKRKGKPNTQICSRSRC